MTASSESAWQRENYRYLIASLRRLRQILAHQANLSEESDGRAEDGIAPEEIAARMSAPPSVRTLVDLFGLTPFERDVILLCAGCELDAGFAQICGAAQGEDSPSFPTFRLALAVLPRSHWSALAPAGPLRTWHLIRLDGDDALTRQSLRIDERILHHLIGISHLDGALVARARSLSASDRLVASHAAIAREIGGALLRASREGSLPAVQLVGGEIGAKRDVAAAACANLGLKLYLMPASALPSEAYAREELLRRWEREYLLGDVALFLDADDDAKPDELPGVIARLVDVDTLVPRFISSRERRGPWQRPVLTFEIEKPSAAEQRTRWLGLLGDDGERLEGTVDQLVSQFNLSAPLIDAVYRGALGRLGAVSDDEGARAEQLGDALWDVCRREARPRLDSLAQRVESEVAWEDLILPPAQIESLRQIAAQVRQRHQVYETWGFRSKGNRGLGISALFSGPSGTGKTLAAEVLANELRLDLYRIDLSQVINKYVGETEKNLGRIFDAAEAGGAILLFDEADALFGHRADVKDSLDRFANVEVSYLLQKMEAYRGLAILTTNLKDSLDTAFARRLRFVVEFPFPSAAERARIWQRVFPPRLPTEGLNFAKLARLDLAGGAIRNIALNAAFLAADERQPVRMGHLLRAARREYVKLERPLNGADVRDWIDAGEPAIR